MNWESDCLFHFTYDLDTIKAILGDRLYGSYARETLRFNGEDVKLFIPTICFCDIPTVKINEFNAYGRYGLGLKKSWGVSKKLNPVIYMAKQSAVADSWVKSVFSTLHEVAQAQKEIATIALLEASNLKAKNSGLQRQLLIKKQNLINRKDAHDYLIYSIYFTKHYEDDLVRSNGKIIKDYRFYEEREWRYVPEFRCAVCELRMKEADYQDWRGSMQKPIIEDVFLEFEHSDIEHIFVASEADVQDLAEWIQNLHKEGLGDEGKADWIGKITIKE